jgi:hypothetical protein
MPQHVQQFCTHWLAQVASTPAEGIMMAREAQESGKAGEVLSKWIEVSQAMAAKEKMVAA